MFESRLFILLCKMHRNGAVFNKKRDKKDKLVLTKKEKYIYIYISGNDTGKDTDVNVICHILTYEV